MKTVIYLDILLLVNFVVAALFLLAAGLLCGVCCRGGRVILGGCVGAAASLALLAPEAPWPLALLYKCATGALAVAAAYGWPGGRCFLRLTAWFWAANLLLTGAVLLPGAQTNNFSVYLPLSPGVLLGSAAGVYLAVQGVLRVLGRSAGPTFPARLTVGGTALTLRAFCDTGFTVQEPVSGKAVVLVRLDVVRAMLAPPLAAYLTSYFAGSPPPPAPELGLRLVPCTTVAGHCILPAVPAEFLPAVPDAAPAFPWSAPHASAAAQPVYAAFADLPPPPQGWDLLVGVG
mgnify:FL=1